MLSEGIKGTLEMTVTDEDTAAKVASGALPVLATPKVVALMENTAFSSIDSELEEGTTTVGSYIALEHLAPTPVGGKVRCESVLTKINGRELTFEITAYDDAGLIARAEHRRAIVKEGRFMEKAAARLE